MRYGLFIMLLACGDKESDTAAEEVVVEETDVQEEEEVESEEEAEETEQ